MSQAYEFKKLTDVETVNGFQEGDEIYIVRGDEIKRLANPKFGSENFCITLDNLDPNSPDMMLSHKLFEDVDKIYKNKGNLFVEFYNDGILIRILANEIVKLPPELIKEQFNKETQCYGLYFNSFSLNCNFPLMVPESEIEISFE